jgi:phage-related protein
MNDRHHLLRFLIIIHNIFLQKVPEVLELILDSIRRLIHDMATFVIDIYNILQSLSEYCKEFVSSIAKLISSISADVLKRIKDIISYW